MRPHQGSVEGKECRGCLAKREAEVSGVEEIRPLWLPALAKFSIKILVGPVGGLRAGRQRKQNSRRPLVNGS